MTHYLFIPLLVLCCTYALVRGGAPERAGALIFAAGCVLTVVALSAPPVRFQSMEIGVLLVDTATFLAFCILAVCANRFWPIWTSALLGLGVIGHFAMLLSPDVIPRIYAIALAMWSYPILAFLVVGTRNHRRRLIRDGADPSWAGSFVRHGPTMPNVGPPR